MILNFLGVFRNFGRICGFRPFESFGQLIIRSDFFRPFSLRPLASLPPKLLKIQYYCFKQPTKLKELHQNSENHHKFHMSKIEFILSLIE